MQNTSVKRLILSLAFGLALVVPDSYGITMPLLFGGPPSQVLGPLEAPRNEAVVQMVMDAHPEINSCDEDSLDKGRALLVDWVAQRLNAKAGRVVWGRKSRGRPAADGTADRPNTDGLTYLREDGKFEIYDVVVGAPPCHASWEGHGPFAQGQNGWWAPPQLGKESGGGGGGTPTACAACEEARLKDQKLAAQLVESLQRQLTEATDAITAKDNRISVLETDLDAEIKRSAELRAMLDNVTNRPPPRCTASIFGIKIPCKIIQ